MMTNGEKLKEIFPNVEISIVKSNYVRTKVAVDWKFEQIPSYYNLFYEDWWNAEYKEPTTKNDLAQERYQDLIEYFGDEKVSKIILENRGQFKAWLERLRWHVKRADELARELELLKGTTKNDLGVDCVSRADVLNHLANIAKVKAKSDAQKSLMGRCLFMVESLPSVTPQEPRWIPVSERLPNSEYGESDSVLVCFENETQDVLYFDGSNWCYPTGETYISVNHKNDWHNKVVAWMPLPQPYSEVEE